MALKNDKVPVSLYIIGETQQQVFVDDKELCTKLTQTCGWEKKMNDRSSRLHIYTKSFPDTKFFHHIP